MLAAYFTFQGVVWTAILVAIIYYAVRRYRLKQDEDFEDRDN